MPYARRTILAATGAVAFSALAAFAFSGSRAAAVEDTYVPLFFAGADISGSRDWCKGFSTAEAAVVSSMIVSWLDLDAKQRTALGELVQATGSALMKAPSLCADMVEKQHSAPVTEQIALLRTQLTEAEVVLAGLERPP